MANSNVWRSKAPYPLPVRRTNGAVEIGGRIYVSGGETRRWDESAGFYRVDPLNRLYVYDPETNRWSRRRDMNRPTSLGVSGVYGGMLYVATQCHFKQFCFLDDLDAGALWRYNPTSDRWTLLGRTPHPPEAGGFVGGRFYLVDRNGLVDAYDPATDTWSTGGPKGPMTLCRLPSFVSFQARLYVLGCPNDTEPPQLLVFDPAAGSWSEAAAPPVGSLGVEVLGRRWVLSRIFRNEQPRLELIGGGRTGNNWQYIP